jgi:hypothetical protein
MSQASFSLRVDVVSWNTKNTSNQQQGRTRVARHRNMLPLSAAAIKEKKDADERMQDKRIRGGRDTGGETNG